MANRRQRLQQQVQLLLDRHGETNPELKRDLEKVQVELARPYLTMDEFAQIALRIAPWVKWIFDSLRE